MEGGVAERARVLRKGVVREQPLGLRYCGLQECFIGGARWEGVGVLGIILCENRRRCGMLFRRETECEKEGGGARDAPGVYSLDW